MGQGHDMINFGVRRSKVKVKVKPGADRSQKSLSARFPKNYLTITRPDSL